MLAGFGDGVLLVFSLDRGYARHEGLWIVHGLPLPFFLEVPSALPNASEGTDVCARFSKIALSGVPPGAQVLKFCDSFRQLKSMGFAPDHIVGALVLHSDDIAAATEACLSCQG